MNTPNIQTKPKRRTRDQWEQLVREWEQSGDSAKAFCTARAVGYASFCQWRKRLQPEEAYPKQEAEVPSFIDLAALTGEGSRAWRIVLSLGNGVELRLSQD